MSPGLKHLVVAAIIAIAIGAYSCGGSDSDSTPTPPTSVPTASPTPSPTPSPSPTPTPVPIDPQALLRESGSVMEGLKSFQFRLEHKSGNTPLIANLVVNEAEGQVIKPDKIAADFKGAFGAFVIKSSLITVGDTSYMTNPLTGQWEGAPGNVSPLGFFNPSRGIADMMSGMDELKVLPDGKGVHRLAGRLPAEALAPLVGSTVKGATVAVDLTIDAKDFYLLEVVIDGRLTEAEPDGTVRVLKLSRFNDPFTIEPPQ